MVTTISHRLEDAINCKMHLLFVAPKKKNYDAVYSYHLEFFFCV